VNRTRRAVPAPARRDAGQLASIRETGLLSDELAELLESEAKDLVAVYSESVASE